MSKALRVTVVLVGLAGLTLAPQAAGGPRTANPGGSGTVAVYNYLDTNRDGRLTNEEFNAMRDTAIAFLLMEWPSCDQNRDGRITEAEFRTAFTAAQRTWTCHNGPISPPVTRRTMSAQRWPTATDQTAALPAILDLLACDRAYVPEVTRVRQATNETRNWNVIYTHIVQNPKQYPRLHPIIADFGVRYGVASTAQPYGQTRGKYATNMSQPGRTNVQPAHNARPTRPARNVMPQLPQQRPTRPIYAQPGRPIQPGCMQTAQNQRPKQPAFRSQPQYPTYGKTGFQTAQNQQPARPGLRGASQWRPQDQGVQTAQQYRSPKRNGRSGQYAHANPRY